MILKSVIILLIWLSLWYLSKQDFYQFQFINLIIAFSIFMYNDWYLRRYLISISSIFIHRKRSVSLTVSLFIYCNNSFVRSNAKWDTKPNKAQNTELSWFVLHLNLVRPEQQLALSLTLSVVVQLTLWHQIQRQC